MIVIFQSIVFVESHIVHLIFSINSPIWYLNFKGNSLEKNILHSFFKPCKVNIHVNTALKRNGITIPLFGLLVRYSGDFY